MCDTGGSVKYGPDVCAWRWLRDGIRPSIKTFREAMSCTVYYTAAFPSAARRLLPRSVPRPKQIHCISEQTAQCREMLPALLPFPLHGWWVDPSQLLQLCISRQWPKMQQGKLPCLFTLYLHLISLSPVLLVKKSIKSGASLPKNPNRNASEPFGKLAGVFKCVPPRFRRNL